MRPRLRRRRDPVRRSRHPQVRASCYRSRRAVDVAVQALQNNVSELLDILVAINLFVGMANLFPMLPLDGGHVAIAIYGAHSLAVRVAAVFTTPTSAS